MKTAFATALLLVAVLPSRRADACECADAFSGVVLPRDGATDVSTEADVWTFGPRAQPTSVALDGVALTRFEAFELEGGTLRRWEVEALRPGSHHTIDSLGSLRSFTVGDGPGVAPEPPNVARAKWEEEGGGLFGGTTSCGDAAFFDVTVHIDGSLLLVDLSPLGGEEIEAADIVDIGFGGDARFTVGDAFCTNNWNFDSKDRAPMRLGALDAAGRFSGWSERKVLEAPACQGGGVGPGGSIGLIGLLLVRLVRRRTADHEALVTAVHHAHDRHRLR